jgi:hypothetical protein
MHGLLQLVVVVGRRGVDTGRLRDRHARAASRGVRPWRERWLLFLVAAVALLDFKGELAALPS